MVAGVHDRGASSPHGEQEAETGALASNSCQGHAPLPHDLIPLARPHLKFLELPQIVPPTGSSAQHMRLGVRGPFHIQTVRVRGTLLIFDDDPSH
jgi:hypothetical protein